MGRIKNILAKLDELLREDVPVVDGLPTDGAKEIEDDTFGNQQKRFRNRNRVNTHAGKSTGSKNNTKIKLVQNETGERED